MAVCNAGYQPLALQVGQYTAVDPALTYGCIFFPANGSTTDSAEYLLVPQATTETPDLTASFRLAGANAAVASVTANGALAEPEPSPAARFHYLLREMEQTRVYPLPSGAAPAPPRSAPVRAAMVSPGDQRVFPYVLVNITKGGYTSVTATAKSVGQHVAIYVDDNAPAGGLQTADLDALRDAFDQNLYPADTAAFGRESDLDNNGMVLVLMTPVVNKYVTAADCVNTGYVAGFFFGLDIDPSNASVLHPDYPQGVEIFYTMVADPLATLSCQHPVSQVRRVVPGVLVHEFQHMISYNHHVVQQPAGSRKGEVLWLNEALSHYAEELGGRTYLPDTATFCNYVSGDLNNAVKYWMDPGSHPLVDTVGLGGLPERGEGWLFVRYLVDRFATDTSLAAQNLVTRALDQTNLRGTANVAHLTGASFATTAGEWALANWASDLPGFSASDALKYKKWAFRTDYPTLSTYCGSLTPPVLIPAAFPLVAVASAGSTISLSGTMMSGSGAAYLRALQAPSGARFNVLFSDATGAQLHATVAPRLNVLRIR